MPGHIDLEIRHLRLMAAVRREGTLTAAASALHMTQPAASHALQQLEHRLGVRLFHRQPRKMEPTSAGKRLLSTADSVLPQLVRAEQDLMRLGTKSGGQLRVTTQCYTCYHWLPRLMVTFSNKEPDIDLRLVPEAGSHPLKALLRREVDVALVHENLEHEAIRSSPLFSDELLLVVAANHPLATRERVEPSDLAFEHLLVHQEFEESFINRSFFEPQGVRPDRISELRLTEAILEVVRAGQGVSILPAWILEGTASLSDMICLRLAPAGLHRTWRVLSRVDNENQGAIATLTDVLTEN